MPPRTSKGVVRHLNYAWIEFGDTRDGQGFTAGLDKLGWKNLVRLLPRKRDRLGSYYVDSAHQLLPIRWRGRARMILPNVVKDCKKLVRPFIKDPLFDAYRAAQGDDAFNKKMRETCEFLSRWVFSPGIKGSPTSDGALTFGADATDHADLVACSGHGSSGLVWGGDWTVGCQLDAALRAPEATSHSPRLKYVLIPTCNNLSRTSHPRWIPALHRANPVHGVFGYSDTYTGDDKGRRVFTRFARNLRERGGRTPIVEAFVNAHTGRNPNQWGVIMHTSARGDTMRDWLASALKTPSSNGELRWYCPDNWPDGQVVATPKPPYDVSYFVGSTKITRDNCHSAGIGLVEGGKGHLEITKVSGTFDPSKVLKVVFFWFRATKPKMDLTKLLELGPTADAKVSLARDLNKRDSTTYVDGFELRASRPGLSVINIPFTVRSGAGAYFNNEAQFLPRLIDGSSVYDYPFQAVWLLR